MKRECLIFGALVFIFLEGAIFGAVEETLINDNANLFVESILNDEVKGIDQPPIEQEKDYEGYIIEFEDKPIIEEKSELDIKAEVNEKYIKEAFVLNPVKLYKQAFSVMPEDVEKKVRDYSSELKINNDKVKERILSRVKDKRARISGRAVDSLDAGSKINIMNSFDGVFNGIALDISDEEAEEIKNVEGVKAVYPNLKVYATLTDSVPLINADDVWQLDKDGGNCIQSGKDCLTGKGITIGIIDTGIDYTHPDLGGCFGDGCKVAGGYDFVNKDSDPIDDNGHGTHVAGIAAANGVLKGVAPDAELYAYKVMNSQGSGNSNNIIEAIGISVDLNENGIPCENENDYVDVISLSLGGSGNPNDPNSAAIDNAALCAIPVIAAGNKGPYYESVTSPGTARKAITVGAIDKNSVAARFSSRGFARFNEDGKYKTLIKPDIVAPGVSICSAQWQDSWDDKKCEGFIDEEHVQISGTSMATPHVSGVAALLKQKHPDWNPEEIKEAIISTAESIGMPIEFQGYGKLDAFRVINFRGIPSIALLETGGVEYDENIDIIGTVKGKEFEKYTIYYGKGSNPEEWVEITTNYNSVENGKLVENFNTDLLDEGSNIIKLVVSNKEGYESYTLSEIYMIKQPILETIVTEEPYIEAIPRIYGDIVIWNTDYNNIFSVYMKNLASRLTLKVSEDIDSFSPSINKDSIVWMDLGGDLRDIFKYDISSNQLREIVLPGPVINPRINGDIIVWDTNHLGIIYFDLADNEIILRDTEHKFKGPIASEIPKVIFGYDDFIISMFNLTSQKEEYFEITNKPFYGSTTRSSLSSYKNKIVWSGIDSSGLYGIYMFDILTGEEKEISKGDFLMRNPSIYKDFILWEDSRNGERIYIYNLLTEKEMPLTIYPSVQMNPEIYENKIVWQDKRNGNSDVYMYKIKSQCSDGIDNDIDGLIDMGDPECENAEDNDEDNINPIYQSKIINKEASSINGNLLIKIQELNSDWEPFIEVLTINNLEVLPGEEIDLAELWNNKDIIVDDRFTTGKQYRIVVEIEINSRIFSEIKEISIV